MKNHFAFTDFIKQFPTQESCLAEIKRLRYPTGMYCRVCKRKRTFFKVKNRQAYSCPFLCCQIYPLKGTPMARTKIPIQKWLYAIYLIAQTRSGVPAKELERHLGVTYKTAWRIGHKIREMMREEPMDKLKGIVEIDETYVGGNFWKNFRKHQKEGYEAKKAVMGMVERNGRSVLVYLPHGTGRLSLFQQIEKYVSKDAHIMTDQYISYKNVHTMGYKHDTVLHKKEFVRGNVYTQNVENVWSHLKRGITGVYRSVGRKHMQKYVNEFEFRYNRRNSQSTMFLSLLSQVATTRVLKSAVEY